VLLPSPPSASASRERTASFRLRRAHLPTAHSGEPLSPLPTPVSPLAPLHSGEPPAQSGGGASSEREQQLAEERQTRTTHSLATLLPLRRPCGPGVRLLRASPFARAWPLRTGSSAVRPRRSRKGVAPPQPTPANGRGAAIPGRRAQPAPMGTASSSDLRHPLMARGGRRSNVCMTCRTCL
jgi:hypothetical protein